jgi:hypothetical protein
VAVSKRWWLKKNIEKSWIYNYPVGREIFLQGICVVIFKTVFL